MNTPAREIVSLADSGWLFHRGNVSPLNCTDSDFPIDLNDTQCLGLDFQAQVTSSKDCRDSCCGDDLCEVWQWCPSENSCSPSASCWTGAKDSCTSGHAGWISQGRDVAPADDDDGSSTMCTQDECHPDFDDSEWRPVDLPHDFVVEGNFTSDGDKSHGYLPYDLGWYRLHFNVPAGWEGKSVWIDFDGVQRDAHVWLNDVFVGNHDSGYTSFRFGIGADAAHQAAVLKYGDDEENVLVVRADASQPDGWWYDGGGIYRDVRLTATDTLHIKPWGVYVPTVVDTDSITTKNTGDAVLKVQTELVNHRDADASFTITHEVFDASGKSVVSATSDALSLASGDSAAFNESIQLKGAALWGLDSPTLYSLTTTLLADDKDVDEVSTVFGVRSIAFTVDDGFLLNNQPVKIQGMANHQDFAGVGVAVPDSLQRYRVQRMLDMGANAWRTAHNPPNPGLLDACDEMGMLVWDENHRNLDSSPWMEDLDSLIRRDRNHPSVVMWSLCNEVLCESFNGTSAANLKAEIQKLDPAGGRPVTAAMNGGYDNDAFTSVLDVMGFNYHVDLYDSYHKLHPDQVAIGSETSSDYSDRGIYANDEKSCYVEAYDTQYPGWGNTAEDAWCPIASRVWMTGGFVWTGFDYKGEPTPYGWPNINSHFGNMDECGFAKDNFYYYQSVWRDDDVPMLHVFPHWNWNEGDSVDVWVYTNADSVELQLNGETVGDVQQMDDAGCRHVSWSGVTFAAGNITALGYRNGSGEIFASDSRVTTGEAAAVTLSVAFPSSGALSADNSDTAVIRATIVDSEGREVPTANDFLSFTLSGPGKIIGFGNGDPSSHESDKPAHVQSGTAGEHSVFNGLAAVVVQATADAGTIDMVATADGLESGKVSIKTSS